MITLSGNKRFRQMLKALQHISQNGEEWRKQLRRQAITYFHKLLAKKKGKRRAEA